MMVMVIDASLKVDVYHSGFDVHVVAVDRT